MFVVVTMVGCRDGGRPGDTASLTSCRLIDDVRVLEHPEVSTLMEVSWTQPEAVDATWISYAFEEGEWSTPEEAGLAGDHTVALLGLPAATPISLRISNRRGDLACATGTFTSQTGALPPELPLPVGVTWNPSESSPEQWLLTTIDVSYNAYLGPFWVVILDRQGRYVWYHEIPESRASLFSSVARDGTHILADGTTVFVWDDSVQPFVRRLTLDLAYLEDATLPDLDLASDEMDGGTLLYAARSTRGHTLVERAPDGGEREVWSCTEHLTSIGADPDDCMPNAVVWNPDTDTVFWSMFGNDTVLEIQRETGEVVRRFGQLPGGWTFDPEASVLDYQHWPNIAPDGSIIVSTHAMDQPGVQYARAYVPDDDARTLHEVWKYQTSEHFAENGGQARRLANGNTLLSYGDGGAIREITSQGSTVWDLDLGTHVVGNGTLIDDLYAINRGP